MTDFRLDATAAILVEHTGISYQPATAGCCGRLAGRFYCEHASAKFAHFVGSHWCMYLAAACDDAKYSNATCGGCSLGTGR